MLQGVYSLNFSGGLEPREAWENEGEFSITRLGETRGMGEILQETRTLKKEGLQT